MNYYASSRNPDLDLRTMKLSERNDMRNLTYQTDLRWNLSGRADLRRHLSERNDFRRNLFEEDLRKDYLDRDSFRLNPTDGEDLRLYLSNRDDLRRNLSERRSQRSRSRSRERIRPGMEGTDYLPEQPLNFRNEVWYSRRDKVSFDERKRAFSSDVLKDRLYDERYRGPNNASNWSRDRSSEPWRAAERDRRYMEGEKIIGTSAFFRGERQDFPSNPIRDWVHSDHRFQDTTSSNRIEWHHTDKQFEGDFASPGRDRLHSELQFKEDLPVFGRSWQHSEHRIGENFSDFGREWKHTDERYSDSLANSGGDRRSERFQEMSNLRREWQLIGRGFEGPRTEKYNDWHFSEQRFSERDWGGYPSYRYHGNNSLERNWHCPSEQFSEKVHDPFRSEARVDERFKETLAISGRDWDQDRADYIPLEDFGRWPEKQPNERNYQGFNTLQSDGPYNGNPVDGPRNLAAPLPFNNISMPPKLNFGAIRPLRPSWHGLLNKKKFKAKKKKNSINKNKNPKENKAQQQHIVLFQYLKKFNTPIEKNHIEHIKKQVMLQLDEDKKKKPERKWDPTFLSYTSQLNGLHVCCKNLKSMLWLLRRRIPPVDNIQFISCNANTPIRKVKLNFLIKNCTYSADMIIHKLDQCNRFINLKRLHVLSCKNVNGNSSLVVMTDSRIASKIKKKKMLLRFENKMIKIFRCRKNHKGKTESDKNNGMTNTVKPYVKKTTANIKPADAQPVVTPTTHQPAGAQPEVKPPGAQPEVKPADAQPEVKPADAQSEIKPAGLITDPLHPVKSADAQSPVKSTDVQSAVKSINTCSPVEENPSVGTT